MRRFYLEPDCFLGDKVVWKEKESRHIGRVLRLQAGEIVMAFDGSGLEYEVELEKIQPDRVSGKILRSQPVNREIPVNLELIQGVAKADKMDWIIQKNVEVGVSAIRPIRTRFTIVKLEGKREASRHQRWENIIRETCKQCRRNRPPILHELETWEYFLQNRNPERLYILFYEAAQDGPTLKQILQQEKDRILTSGISLLIGPEGGWSEEEIQSAQAHGICVAGLGPRILRTETAGIVASSVVLYELGALE